jgi:hypothetical protein
MRRIFYEKRAWFIPLIPFAIAGFLALAGFIVMNLWNALIPVIFHLGVITFWQAVGIFILCKILFGFGRGGRGGGRGPWMRNRMEDRFKNMTPEEKERFKEQVKNYRCGDWGRGDRDSRHPFDPDFGYSSPSTEKPTE